ncbi:MAG TPA: FadR/GntR family transcriptional regulator [Gemmataceae bacterium]|jgi:GntR family transcriptional repressor for pyruvate dehydrogenase complex
MSRTDHVSYVADQLERAILSGEFAAGDLLPSERELSDRLNVSRSVVREALGQLRSLGLIRSVHGSGTRVEAPNDRLVTLGYQRLLHRPDFRLEHLAEVRLPLETTIAALAAVKRTAEQIARLKETQKILGSARRALEAHVKADLDFHATLAEATGNPFFQTVLAPIQQLLIESRRRTLGRYGSEIAYRHHGKILAAVEAGDADAASRAMREHIEANYQHLHQVGDNSA